MHIGAYSKLIFTLLIFSFLAVFFQITESIAANNTYYWFLSWNLFLAYVPVALSYSLYIKKVKDSLKLSVLVGFWWTMFYPNSTYLITDFVHIGRQAETDYPNIFLIYMFALIGLMCANISLYQVSDRLKQKFNLSDIWVWTFNISIISLSSFGVYIGRLLRLNSWQVLTHPLEVARTILNIDYISREFITFNVLFIILTLFAYILFHISFNKNSSK